MKVLVVVVVLMIAMSGMPALGDERPRVLCGRNLADARLLYCFSADAFNADAVGTDSIQQQKRAGSNTAAVPKDKNSMMNAWRDRSLVLELVSRGKRDQGLVDECCYKPCYISELLNYC